MAERSYFSDDEDANLLYHEEYRDKKTKAPRSRPAPSDDIYHIVGKDTKRIDGRRIVTGDAPFTHDINLRGMLAGKILRSPHACAEVVSVNLEKARNVSGVKAVIQLKEGTIKYAGEQVAAVAAVDEKTAIEALKYIRVEYKVLPHAVRVEDARQENAPRVYEDRPNVRKFNEYERGDVEKGFREADVVMERTYSTAVLIHHPTETHGSVARWDGDKLTVWDSTQAIFGVRDGLARYLKIPASKITVIKQYMGGGFGSKLGLNDYTVAAVLLARESKKPVKIILSRRENSYCTGNRPSSLQTIKGGVKTDGSLTALSLINYGGGGLRNSDRCAEPIIDLYTCPNLHVEEYSVFTHTNAARPMRAPGHVQGTLALEGFLDELADRLGIDPLDLRKKNYSTKNEGDTGIPYSSKGLDQCYTKGAQRIGWQRRNKRSGGGRGKVRRGMGMASQIWWGVGRAGTLADVKLHRDGSVEVVCGTQDLGTGTRTYMATITADTLGLKPEQIGVRLGKTTYPWCGSSGGSTTTPSVAPAVRDAALQAAEFVKKMAADKMEISESQVMVEQGVFINEKDPEQSVLFKEVLSDLRREKVFHGEYDGRPSEYAYNSFGAHFAEVEVDTETGQIRVLRVVAAHDIGRVINKWTAESQVIGGVTQGVGYALFEQRIMDPHTGTMVNANFRDYKIPTSKDIPKIEPLFADNIDPYINNMGTKGLGEPPMIPIAAAIANAVYNAIGVHPREIPMTPDRILAALKRKEEGR